MTKRPTASELGPVHDAVILAGGAGTRLGGLDKAAVVLGGQPLIAAALRASAGARSLVVVGSTGAPLPPSALVVREDPPGAGPAAGFFAGLEAIDDPAPWTLLLACDLPGASAAADALLSACRAEHAPGIDGHVLVDPDGTRQWVAGIYRSSAVRRRILEGAAQRGGSLRGLLGPLSLATVDAQADEWRDVDTWDDHERWTKMLRGDD